MGRSAIYPLFIECQKYIVDEFWRTLIEACSHGKFPKGMKYNPHSNVITVKTSNSSQYEVFDTSLPPEVLYKLLLKIFRSKLNIYSPNDIRIQKEKLEKIRKTQEIVIDKEWKDIKPRSFKDIFLINYTIKMQTTHNLSDQATRSIYNSINLAFQYKQLISDDIVYENGKILNIKNMEYDNLSKRVLFSRAIPKVSQTVKKNEKCSFFLKSMENYVKNFDVHKI